jgi:hypothetical protein
MCNVQVVGFEGLYGMLLMVFAVCPAIFFIPGSDVGGKLENSLDSIELIKSSKPILILCVCQACAMLMYNFAGMCVTDHLGAVFRTILETLVRIRCSSPVFHQPPMQADIFAKLSTLRSAMTRVLGSDDSAPCSCGLWTAVSSTSRPPGWERDSMSTPCCS